MPRDASLAGTAEETALRRTRTQDERLLAALPHAASGGGRRNNRRARSARCSMRCLPSPGFRPSQPLPTCPLLLRQTSGPNKEENHNVRPMPRRAQRQEETWHVAPAQAGAGRCHLCRQLDCRHHRPVVGGVGEHPAPGGRGQPRAGTARPSARVGRPGTSPERKLRSRP